MTESMRTAQEARARRPPLLACAFRPFFLLAACWMLMAMALWLASLSGAEWAPTLSPGWHAHEMLFAVVSAAAAGFALTAVATWTGTPPMAGLPLAGLIALWLFGRGVMLADALPNATVGTVNVLFLLAVALALWLRLQAAGNRRNYPVVLILAVLAAAQATWHFAALDSRLAIDAGLLTVAAMISLIAGRITPAFTRNWLRGHKRFENVRDVRLLEVLNVGAVLLAALMILAGARSLAAGLCLVASFAAMLRLLGWNGQRILSEPLLWILHLAWLWLTLALLLAGLTELGVSMPATLWWHVLGAGAIGTILIGVMTRVALGHTGRPLQLPRGTMLLYALISIAAIARMGAALLSGAWWLPLLMLSGAAWMLAWSGYLYLFTPILIAPRPDGRPG